MEKEIWKDIPGYEGLYQVSNIGRVKSLARDITDTRKTCHRKERILKLIKDKYGYNVVCLRKNGNPQNMKVHRLVAMAFIPNPYDLPMVNHKNEIRNDNHVENLEWCDAKYNVNYGNAIAKILKAKKENGAYSCEKKVICNGVVYNSMTDCADALSVSVQNIYRWVNGINNMPFEFEKMGLRLLSENEMPICKKPKRIKAVICGSRTFNTITDCANHFGIPMTTMRNWLKGLCQMPQKFQDLGLRYA